MLTQWIYFVKPHQNEYEKSCILVISKDQKPTKGNKNRDIKIKTDYWDLGFPPGNIKHD